MTSSRGTAVVVSDLDGTLLHRETYSFDEALPGIASLKERAIPVILVSSKTRAEIEPIREALGLEDPFVVENGGRPIYRAARSKRPSASAILRDGTTSSAGAHLTSKWWPLSTT